MAFPTLQRKPVLSSLEETAGDPVVRSPKEGGYIQTRPRYTRVPKKWHVRLQDMEASDKSSLKAWEIATQYGADADTWTHPDGTSYTVRLAAPIKYTYGKSRFFSNAEFDLEEV